MSRTLLRTPNLDLSQKANNKSQSVFSQYYDAIDASNWWRALMPNKYPQKKGWNIPKQKYKLTKQQFLTKMQDLLPCFNASWPLFRAHGILQLANSV